MNHSAVAISDIWFTLFGFYLCFQRVAENWWSRGERLLGLVGIAIGGL